MSFHWYDWIQHLCELDAPPIQAASVEEINKESNKRPSLFAVYLFFVQPAKGVIKIPELQKLLGKFSGLFQEPTQFPPSREISHHIALKEGTEPINVWPYRYAYFQKAKIEWQVDDMIKSRLIRPSTSPFSSPVLLVRKKDDT